MPSEEPCPSCVIADVNPDLMRCFVMSFNASERHHMSLMDLWEPADDRLRETFVFIRSSMQLMNCSAVGQVLPAAACSLPRSCCRSWLFCGLLQRKSKHQAHLALLWFPRSHGNCRLHLFHCCSCMASLGGRWPYYGLTCHWSRKAKMSLTYMKPIIVTDYWPSSKIVKLSWCYSVVKSRWSQWLVFIGYVCHSAPVRPHWVFDNWVTTDSVSSFVTTLTST